MKPQPVRFGVELEFVGPGIKYCRHLLTQKFGILRPSRRGNVTYDQTWTLAIDPSVLSDDAKHRFLRDDDNCDRFAMELRTPILTPDQLPKMRRVLELFRPFCFITHSCGMHVHLSTPAQAVLDCDGMAVWLWERYGKSIWNCRRRFCVKGTTDHEDYDVEVDKYRVVNIIDRNARHIEYRLFNGTLEYKAVAERVRASIDCFRRFMKVGTENGYGRPYERLPRVKSIKAPATVVEEAPTRRFARSGFPDVNDINPSTGRTYRQDIRRAVRQSRQRQQQVIRA